MYFEPRAEHLLSPCKFGDNIRQQTYVQAQTPSALPGTEIRISLPTNETADLSNSYITFDINVTNPNVGAQLALSMVYAATTAPSLPDTGFIELYAFGKFIGKVAYNAIGTDIVTAFNASIELTSRNILASTGNPANTLVAGVGIIFASFEAKYLLQNPFHVANATYQLATGLQSTIIQTTVPYARPTPAIEKFCPIVNRLYVNFNSTTVIDINDANKLQAVVSLFDGKDNQIGKDLELPYEEQGFIFTSGTRVKAKISLDFIDLFKTILPMEMFNNPQVTIYLLLEQPQYCLICSNATNSAAQSYSISNIKLKYHRLMLTDNDKSLIKNSLHSQDGLIIPFKSWTTFKTTLAAGSTNQNVIFNPNRKHLLGVCFVMLDQVYYSDATNIRKYSVFLKNNIDNYRLKIGNFYFPLDRVESSNTYLSFTEQCRTTIEFAEVVRNIRIIDNMELFDNFSGNTSTGPFAVGTIASNTVFDPSQDNYIHTTNVMGILTSDIGYSDSTHMCSRLALQGVDTSSLPNVVLELNGMTVINNNDLIVYSLSQEYLVFKPNSFDWLK